jgi:hypothetical protein
MKTSGKYILKGKRVIPVDDLYVWGEWMEKRTERRVAKTTLSDGKWVSTVFLGLDHNFTRKGRPLLFETMVFPKRGDNNELDMDRYSTWSQAEKGHKKMVDKWEKEVKKK